MNLTPHKIEDIETYACFLFGQFLFVLKRAGSAVMSPTAAARSIKEYLGENWIRVLVRLIFETAIIFNLIRHYTIADLLQKFGIDTSNGWFAIFAAIPTSIWSLTAIGYMSDSLFDWITRNPKLPKVLRDWFAENVPPLPSVREAHPTLSYPNSTKEA
jgi:hypothetical protein